MPGYGRARHGGGGGRRRKRTMIALIAGAVAVVVVAGVVIYKVAAGPGVPATGFVPSGSTPAQDAAQITTAFLQAWETDDYAKAAANPEILKSCGRPTAFARVRCSRVSSSSRTSKISIAVRV